LGILEVDVMNIQTPLSKVEETKRLIDVGANELYCGVVHDKWKNNYNLIASNNRNDDFQPNLTSFKDLKKVTEIAHSYNVSVFTTFNSPFHTKKQYSLLLKDIGAASNCNVDAFIISDLGLLFKVNKMGLGIPITMSTLGTIFNSETVSFYRDLGVKRVILERHLTLDEIKCIKKNTKGVDLEAFIFSGKCINIEGFCTFHHRLNQVTNPIRKKLFDILEGSDNFMEFVRKLPQPILKFLLNPKIISNSIPCRLDYNSEVISKNKIGKEGDKKINKKKIPDYVLTSRYNSNFMRMTHTSCGACAMYDLKNIGIKSVKIVGRRNVTSKKIRDIKFLAELDRLLKKEKIKKSEFIEISKNLFKKTYRDSCTPLRCYYPSYIYDYT